MKTIQAIVMGMMLMGVVGVEADVMGEGGDRPIRLAHSPELSPDGKRLLFESQGDLWKVGIDGGEAKRLTLNGGRDGSPMYSADGKRIAFVSDRSGSRQVYVMDAAGGEAVVVTHHSEGAALVGWSANGKRLLIYGNRDHGWKYGDRFFWVDVAGRSREELLFDSEGREGSLSPDGKRLLFVREGEREWRKGYSGERAAQIWLFDLKKKKFTQVLKMKTGCRAPVWKADGSGFYYAGSQGATNGERNLWGYDFKTKVSTQLTDFDDDLVMETTVSGDGKTVVFKHLFDLYRKDVGKGGGGEVKRIDVFEGGDRMDDDTMRRTLTKANAVGFTHDGLEMALVVGGDLYVMDTELREPVAVTETGHFESAPVFNKDASALYFVGQDEGQVDIYRARRAEKGKYWWQNENFVIEKVTDDAVRESGLKLSPAGDALFYGRGRGELWRMGLGEKGGKPRQILDGFDRPSYDFSPDGRWIVYAQTDNDFNYDIWVKRVDGKGDGEGGSGVNISRHPDDEWNPVWSPDGKMIAFSGERSHDETDLHYVWLSKEDDDETSRQRKLEKAIELMKKGRKKVGVVKKEVKGEAGKEEGDKEEREKAGEEGEKKKEEEAKKKVAPEMKIDFEEIHRRVRTISMRGSSERGLFWSPDSKRLAFRSSIDGKSGTYTVSIPDDVKPKLLSTTTGSSAKWMKDKILWLVSGVPQGLKVGSGGASGATNYSFRVNQEVDVPARYAAAFDDSWRTMRDAWYDSNLGNRDWDAVRAKYRPMAEGANDTRELSEVIHLMLGELNGSHLGFYANSTGSSGGNDDDWREVTAHLGLRFDGEYDDAGLLVNDVLPTGPASDVGAGIVAGDVVLAIDGVAVDGDFDLTQVLNGSLQRDVLLRVVDVEGEERDVSLRPISYSAARGLVYKGWLAENRRRVNEQSEGTLGYLHISAMDWGSFMEFERELYDVGYGKEGLVIDVRNNGGGSTADYLLTALTQPRHAFTIPREGGVGYPQSRKIFATWSKPIVVLCNQNSYSNAEIFAHAIKGLKRGKLIGVPTAGGVISTGSVTIMDVGRLRLPFRGWFVAGTGEDMELNGAVPDIAIWPKPGDYAKGVDTQLKKGVDVLKREVKKAGKKAAPEAMKATNRTPTPE